MLLPPQRKKRFKPQRLRRNKDLSMPTRREKLYSLIDLISTDLEGPSSCYVIYNIPEGYRQHRGT